MSSSAGRLVPHYTEWGTEENRVTPSIAETTQDRFKERARELALAPNLDNVIRKEYEEAELSPLPDNTNLAYRAVMGFRQRAKDATALGEAIKMEQDAERKKQLLALYNDKRTQLEQYLEYGVSFERAYREYIRTKNATAQLRLNLQKQAGLEREIEDPLNTTEGLTSRVQTRLEAALRDAPERVFKDMEQSLQEDLNALAVIYNVDPENPPRDLTEEEQKRLDEKEREKYKKSLEDWNLYKEASNKLLGLGEKPISPIKTERQLKTETIRLKKEAERLWARPGVQRMWNREEMRGFIEAVGRGDRVIETQSVIEILNKLDESERKHQNTTVGAVLVGPPGVGKTTIIRHYLERKNRGYVYIDLSEDVTRYLLYGSKAIEFKNPADRFRELAQIVEGLSEEEFIGFVTSNTKELENLERLKQEGAGGKSAVASFVGMLGTELQNGLEDTQLSDETRKTLKIAQDRLADLAKGAFVNELGREFAHIVSRNGWRDGLVIAALRRGDSVIFDEFPQFKSWAALHGLMTARPGEKWKFADNVEEILIPDDWRMYFTGNIGRRHNSPAVVDNFAQRVQHEVIYMGYPPSNEEMRVAWAFMSRPDGKFLRSQEDFIRLCVFIDKCLPLIRPAIEQDRQSIPFSYRTLGVIAEELVVRTDPKTKKPVYTATPESFDAALYKILIESQALYESKEASTKIATILVNAGLLLSPEIEDKVALLVGKHQYEEAKKTYTPDKVKDMYDDIMEKSFGVPKPRKTENE